MNPRDPEILMRALAWEKQTNHPFTWSDVRATPTELMRLVVQGSIRVVGRAQGRNLYGVVRKGAK